jgi:hypothetical protein
MRYFSLQLVDDESLEGRLHGLLERVARRGEIPGGIPVGYETHVGPFLMDTLSFFDDPIPSASGWVRLYASFSEERGTALMVGEGLDGLSRDLPPGEWHSSPPSPPGLSWGLIGMADRGWIVLFDDSIDEPMKERLDEDIMVAYMPLSVLDGVQLDPQVPPSRVQDLMVRWFLAYLPDREDYDL